MCCCDDRGRFCGGPPFGFRGGFRSCDRGCMGRPFFEREFRRHPFFDFDREFEFRRRPFFDFDRDEFGRRRFFDFDRDEF